MICFSLLYQPEIDSLLENWENVTAAGSEKANEAMGKVWDSSYLKTSKSGPAQQFAQVHLLLT